MKTMAAIDRQVGGSKRLAPAILLLLGLLDPLPPVLHGQAYALPLDVQQYITIAEEAPGFGGYFVNPETQVAYAWSARPENDDAVATAVRMHRRRSQGPVILRGDFDFRDLWRWQQQLLEVGLSHLSRIGVSHSENRISIGIKTESDRLPLLELATSQGVPHEALSIGVFGPVQHDGLVPDVALPRSH